MDCRVLLLWLSTNWIHGIHIRDNGERQDRTETLIRLSARLCCVLALPNLEPWALSNSVVLSLIADRRPLAPPYLSANNT
ncbi:hypothetical protein TcasGA2_TC033090 [Tribolium castaneum]|uniref:Uncharacterized protein n=1 Tax=Tribolium castaneum TaxID=7070 RepID=A0A139WI62_TRICA|nr:hypothetical protein TcasGA2_TC033090 [Tribolium castaneum]